MKRMHSVFLLFRCLVVPAMAQINTASLTGLITDATGAVVPDAKITARNQATHFERAVASDSSGYYYFASLPIGS